MAVDLLKKVLQEVRGTGEPESPYTDGIYWDITENPTDEGGAPRLAPGMYSSMQVMHEDVGIVAPIAADVVVVAGIASEVVTVAGIETEIKSLYNDKATLDSLYADKITLDSLFTDKAVFDSLYADKVTLDSLYADKAALDSIFADKAKLDSLFADKATLDSLFADKVALDSLYADKATIDRIFASITEIDRLFLSADNIDAVAPSAVNIDIVAPSIGNVDIVATNVLDVNNYADTYYGPKTANPTLRNDGSPMVAGDMYFNTTVDYMRTFDGATWSDSFSGDFYTKAATDDLLGGKLDLAGGTVTGQIKGITPVAAEDLTRKDYVDMLETKVDSSLVSIPCSNTLAGTTAFTNTINTLVFDSVLHTGQTTTVGYDYTIDTLEKGEFFWNSTGSTQVIDVRLPDGTVGTESVLTSTGLLNTGFTSCDLTVSGNGNGIWHDRVAGDCIIKNDAGTVVPSGSMKLIIPIVETHTKNRDAVLSNYRYDGLRGTTKRIKTDTTEVESTLAGGIIDFNTCGHTVGTDSSSNGASNKIVTYIKTYTHIKWGLTSQGERYIEAYNPTTNEGISMYIGSGLAGHRISHSMGVELDVIESKGLSIIADWTQQNSATSFDFAMNINLPSAQSPIGTSWFYDITHTEVSLGLTGNFNSDGNTYIMYYRAKSETWTSGTYVGAAGISIETKDSHGVVKKPSRIIIKGVSASGEWVVQDNKRAGGWIFLDLSNIEQDLTGAIVFTSTGFNINTADGRVNSTGNTYYYEAHFDTNADGGGSYDDLESDTTQYQITDGQYIYADGYVDGHAKNQGEFIQGVTTITPINGWQEGNNYLYKLLGGGYYTTLFEPSYGSISATGNYLLSDGIWRDSSGTPLATPITYHREIIEVANGIPVDKHPFEYPSTILDRVFANSMLVNFPTADPFVVGEIWNDANTLKISTGA